MVHPGFCGFPFLQDRFSHLRAKSRQRELFENALPVQLQQVGMIAAPDPH
jgi:hypothetical protein